MISHSGSQSKIIHPSPHGTYSCSSSFWELVLLCGPSYSGTHEYYGIQILPFPKNSVFTVVLIWVSFCKLFTILENFMYCVLVILSHFPHSFQIHTLISSNVFWWPLYPPLIPPRSSPSLYLPFSLSLLKNQNNKTENGNTWKPKYISKRLIRQKVAKKSNLR